MKFLRALSFTCFTFGLLGWLYIVANSEIHPLTLPMPLTHFASWPREDTFGALCFATAFISFLTWNLIREYDRKK